MDKRTASQMQSKITEMALEKLLGDRAVEVRELSIRRISNGLLALFLQYTTGQQRLDPILRQLGSKWALGTNERMHPEFQAEAQKLFSMFVAMRDDLITSLEKELKTGSSPAAKKPKPKKKAN